MDEFDRIRRLAALYESVGASEGTGVVLGIGDDAAILRAGAEGPGGEDLVWTIDEHVEGTHFRRDLMSLEDVGYRALIAAVSDVAAMGARPWCVLSALVMPVEMDGASLDALGRGIAAAARAVGVKVVGGNLARGPALAIATTVLGRGAAGQGFLRRSGTRVGDGVHLAGPVGLAAAGLEACRRRGARGGRASPGVGPIFGYPAEARALEAFLRPRARIDAGLAAVTAEARAAIDVSDGLAQDAGHLATAGGVALVLDAPALLAHGGADLMAAAASVDRAPLDLALAGGEDFALLVTGSRCPEGFTTVGVAREGSGVWLRDETGERPAPSRGFDHFR